MKFLTFKYRDPWLFARAAVLSIAVTIAVFPFYWMLRTSVAPADDEFLHGVQLLSSQIDFSNYSTAWTEAELGRAMLNGFIVTLAIIVAQLLTVVPAAFAFSALQFRGRQVLFFLVLASLLIPTSMTTIPNYVSISHMGLNDTRIGLILPWITSAFGIFLIRQHMLTVPAALVDAARIDGLSTFQLLHKVYVPLAKPAIATFCLFSFYAHWNDYLWPLLVVRSEALRTPPLSLAVFAPPETGNLWGPLTAGAAIITLPVVVAFLLAQRQFIRGIAGGEVVG